MQPKKDGPLGALGALMKPKNAAGAGSGGGLNLLDLIGKSLKDKVAVEADKPKRLNTKEKHKEALRLKV